MARLFLLCLLFCSNILFSEYPLNPYVTQEVREAVTPFFLPENHPIKKKLDSIFYNKRVTANLESIREAGFEPTEVQGVVCLALKHKECKGYVFKVLPDDRKTRVDWECWVRRVKGSKRLRRAILEFGYDKYFKVAKKWIYPLPAEPSPSAEFPPEERKNYILVVENLDPIARKKNWSTWRKNSDENIYKKLIDIVTATGAGDCVRPNNIPWCHDGRIALVDTETTLRWPVNFHPMLEVTNKKMRKRLKKIIKERGGSGYILEKPSKHIQ